MENIYFQPNKENSEFLAKLEKLDEYTIPQILERMVDHFRTLPELEDALNKLGIKTDSLEEELDEDIQVKETFWLGGKPKSLEHLKAEQKLPILEKRWYKSGQLRFDKTSEYYQDYDNNNKLQTYVKEVCKSYFSGGSICKIYESVRIKMGNNNFDRANRYNQIKYDSKQYYRTDQLQSETDLKGDKYYDMDGNTLDYNEYIDYEKRESQKYKGTKGENFRNKWPFDNSYDK